MMISSRISNIRHPLNIFNKGYVKIFNTLTAKILDSDKYLKFLNKSPKIAILNANITKNIFGKNIILINDMIKLIGNNMLTNCNYRDIIKLFVKRDFGTFVANYFSKS